MSLKKRIAYFVCAVCMIALAFPAFGFTLSGEANLGRDGKATVRLTVQSELGETEFREKLDTLVEAYCNDSSEKAGARNAVVVKGVEKTANGYVVTAVTRRIDKVTVSGAMDYAPATDYAIPDSMERRSIRDWMRGDYHTTITSIKGDVRDSVKIGRPSNRDDSKLNYDADDKLAIARDAKGNVYNIEKDVEDEQVDFFTAGSEVGVFEDIAKSNKNTKVAKFFFADVDGVTDATITFAGKVKYYGGNNTTLIDEKTVKFDAGTIKAYIISSEEGAEPEYKTVSMLAGWVVVDNGTSPLTIALATIAAVVVGGGLITFIIHVNNLGKKAIAKEEEDKQ